MWTDISEALTAHSNLTYEQSRWAMDELMSGAVPDDVIAAFLLGLRAKGETATEIAGLLDGLLAASVLVDVATDVTDVVGTGGDGHHSVNISTMAAIVVAASGRPVVKHGNRAATSKCGSADVLEALGLTLALTPESVATCVREVGIGFCCAPAFHPSMRFVGPVRRSLGVPTVFNVLGPLANPARARSMLVGCADESKAELIADVLSRRGTAAAVVRSHDGMDEVSTATQTTFWWHGDRANFDPVALGAICASQSELAGGDAVENAEVVRAVFGGVRNTRIDAIRDCVAVNAAAASAVTDAAPDVSVADLLLGTGELLEQMRDVIATGAAGATLDGWVALTHDVN